MKNKNPMKTKEELAYKTKGNNMKILGLYKPDKKMARTALTSNAVMYSWTSITIDDAVEEIKGSGQNIEWVMFHQTKNIGKHEGVVPIYRWEERQTPC